MFLATANPALAAITSPSWFRRGRPYVWLDCDIGPDPDDMVHITLCIDYHKRGLINLVGLTASSYDANHGPGLRSILDANGLTGTLVGVIPSAPPSSNAFTATITTRYRPNETSATYPTAVAALRTGLASVPDNSLILLSGGGMTALSGLLQSAADGIDGRIGAALVAAKIKLWAGMIGFINFSSEYNVELDRSAAVYVAANWPTPMIWVGGAFGGSIYLWPDPTASNIDEWKTPTAYCAMRPISSVGWDIAAFFAALINNGHGYLWPRGTNGTMTIDPGSGLPTFVPSNGGNRAWYDLVLGQKDIAGGRLTDMITQMLPRNASLGKPVVSFDFVAQTYTGGSLTDFVCTGAAGRTATNKDGSTVAFGANQLRITDQGLFLVGDLVAITGTTFAAMTAPKLTILMQFATLNSPGNGRLIACKNETNSNYYLLAHAPNNVSSWTGSFSSSQSNVSYLPSGQTWPCPAIAAYQTDSFSTRIALNGGYSSIVGTPMPAPTNLYLGTDANGGQSCTNTILTKLTVYADPIPATLLAPQTIPH